jgi:peroxiredoxin
MEDAMTKLSIGDKAPNFELPVTMEETWKLSENLHDKTIVLLFFPLAFSPACHDELCSIRDGFNEFRNLDATVIAVSTDNPFVLNKWKDELGLPFELLSDFNKETAQAYGAFHEKLGPLRGVAKRAAFVIDRDGVIQYVWVSDDPGTLPDVEAIKKALDELK